MSDPDECVPQKHSMDMFFGRGKNRERPQTEKQHTLDETLKELKTFFAFLKKIKITMTVWIWGQVFFFFVPCDCLVQLG